MTITVQPGTTAMLEEVIDAVASWQQDGTPVQLHPGDLGWDCSFGAQSLADELRVWRRGERVLAAGMVTDDIGLIRMAIAPSVNDDEEFAVHLLEDLSNPDQRVLPAGRGLVEARFGAAFRDVLRRGGWVDDEPWTPLCRDLTAPVEDCGLRIETIDTHHVRDDIVGDRVVVQRASFPNSTFTLERWQVMAASPAYRRARCLVAYDGEGHAVAATTVWSAGKGRPGLIEPLGAHRDRRVHSEQQRRRCRCLRVGGLRPAGGRHRLPSTKLRCTGVCAARSVTPAACVAPWKGSALAGSSPVDMDAVAVLPSHKSWVSLHRSKCAGSP